MYAQRPDTLPSLHIPSSGSWIAGFGPIVAYLTSAPDIPSLGTRDLDAGLSPAARADSTAYATFLAAHAAPLVALSLYVSSENWVTATRPAYSAILSFPLTWTEPPAVRATASRRAAHLGLSELDTDAEPEPPATAEERRRKEQQSSILAQIPQSLRMRRRGVRGALAPEQAARIRLEGAAAECLSVLADLKGEKRFFLSDDGQPTALDCLAFGHLALMLVPELPRPFLRDTMRRRYAGLCSFVEHVRRECFTQKGDDDLPWATKPPSVLELGSRFAFAALGSIPGVGEEWHRWTMSRRRAAEDKGQAWSVEAARELGSSSAAAEWLLTAAGVLSGVALLGGLAFCRGLLPFGSPVVRYERERKGLRGFGAAGAALGLGLAPASAFALEDASAEVGVPPSRAGTSLAGE